ncbi:MAG: LysM peptidoglycan-binding domain-containing protein [Clostridiales bacterium]|nr:LysM peptidoglycan-binding domain-containing protein [Clostridiales bacterium]
MSSGINIEKRAAKRRVLRVKPLLILAALAVSICFLMGAALASGTNAVKESGKSDTEYVEIIVKKGDTIWGLVREARPGYRGNIQKAVYEIKQINGLDSSVIYPGQILKIPIN